MADIDFGMKFTADPSDLLQAYNQMDEATKSFVDSVALEFSGITVEEFISPQVGLWIRSFGELTAVTSIATAFIGDRLNILAKDIGFTIPPLEQLRAQALKTFSEFETAAAKVASITGSSEKLQDSFRKLSQELNFQISSIDLLANSYDVVSAGFTESADTLEVTRVSAKLAAAGFTEVNVAVDALTSILKAYNLTSAEAQSVADKLIKTQNLGKLTIDSYGKTIGRVASIAAQAGVSFDELNAFVVTSTARGMQAAEAVTGLRQAIANVLSPSAEAKRQAKELGIEFNAAALSSKGLSGILKSVEQRTGSLKLDKAAVETKGFKNALVELQNSGDSTVQKLIDLFGSVEAVSVLLTATGDNAKDFTEALSGIQAAAGDVDAAFSTVTGTFQSQVNALFQGFDEIKIGFGKAIAGTLKPVVEQATGVIKIFNSIPDSVKTAIVILSEGVRFLGVAAAAILPALAANAVAQELATRILPLFSGALSTLNIAVDLTAVKAGALQAKLLLTSAATKVAQIATALWTGNLTALQATIDLVAIKTFLLETAQKAFNLTTAVTNGILLTTGTLLKAMLVGLVRLPLAIAELATGFINLGNTALGSALSTKIFSAAQVSNAAATGTATGALTTATVAQYTFAAGSKFVAAQIIATSKVIITQFIPALVSLAAKVAAFVIIFEGLRLILSTPFRTNESLKSIQDANDKLIIGFDKVGKATDESRQRLNGYVAGFQKIGANIEKSGNLFAKASQVLINAVSILTGQADKIDEFGNAFGSFNLATQAQKELADSTIALSDFIAQTSANYGRATNVLIQYRNAQNLTAEQQEKLKKQAQFYIKELQNEISAYKEIKPANEAQKNQIEFEISAREKLLDKLASVVKGRQIERKTIESTKQAYEEQTKMIKAEIDAQIAKILEKQAAGISSEQETQEKIKAIELKGLQDRLAASKGQVQQLKDNLIGLDPVKDAETIKNTQAEIATIEGEGLKLRIDIAKQRIANRQQIEEQTLKQIVEANKKAQDAVAASVQGQITEVRKLGLAREEEAKKISSIEASATTQRVGIIQQEIAQIAQALNQGTIDRKSANARLLELNSQLATENQKRIETTIAQEQALVASILASGKQKTQAAVEAEKNTQAQVATLLNQGVITREQADKKILESSLARYQAEFDAAKSNLDRLLALPSPTDPVAERERIEAIKQARSGLTESTINLQEQIAKKDRAILEQKLAGFEQEQSALEAQSKSLQRQQELRAAQANLANATNDAAIARSELEITKLQEALDIRQRLDSEANLSQEQRILLQQRLNELGISGGSSEQQIRQQILAEQNKLLAVKRQSFEAQQSADRAELESRLQLQQLELQSLKIESDKAIARAAAKDATEAEKLAAQQLSVSYQEQVTAFGQLAQSARDTLAVQQQSALESFNAQEQASRFKANLDAAAQSTTRVNEGLVSVRTNQQIAADQAERQAIALARVADNAQRLKENSDQVTQSFRDATDQLENLRQGFVAVTANNAFTGQVDQAISVNIKVAETLQLRKEEIAILQQQRDINQKITELAQQGDRLALEAAIIERKEIEQKLGNIQEEIRYNNQLVELKKQQDTITKAINASGGISTNQNERLRSLAQDLVDLSKQRQKSLFDEAFAIQTNAQQQSLAVQNVRGLVEQLVNRYAQIPQQIGASADQANVLGSNISNAVGGTQALASGFDRVTQSIRNAANASANLNRLEINPPGRAEGGAVLPTGYTVNERGRESVLDFRTGQISLLPPGRRQMEFKNPGFIFTAEQTKKMFARANGGLVLPEELNRLLRQAITVSGVENGFRFKNVLENPTETNVREAINTASSLARLSPERSGLPAFYTDLEANLQALLNELTRQVSTPVLSTGSLLGNSSTQRTAQARSGGSFRGFAGGGSFNVSPANSFIAGERGAELISLDGRGGARIFNANETKQMLRGFTPKLPGFQSGGTFQSRSSPDTGIGQIVQKLNEVITSTQETTKSVQGLTQKLDRPNVNINSVEPPGQIVSSIYAEISRRNINSNA